MHELSLSGAIVDTAVRHARGRRVTLVSLRVGALRQVVPDSLAFYFEFVARGTLCEGARLEQE
ncbi:MAG: hydrogenase maturation nickel metallochaperone HypA, partial [Solirubrobacteraceae bacterium]